MAVAGVLATAFIAAPVSAGTLSAGPRLSAAVPMLAQSRGEENSRTRYSRRGTKGIVKIAIFGGAAALGVGGWAIRKMRGE